ncbi:MAG: putative NTE family protein [Lysobacteraceae bacterium]|nr:MAG: putative NTE family protein [Xanthomonadaceae bacterium]
MEAEARQAVDIALVLGSGGARGLAHIGVIEELEREGFRVVAIAGASMGALVGGIHAAGRLHLYRDWVCSLERSDVVRLLDFAFGHPGLIKGEKVIGVMRELVGQHRIEELPVPFTAVATDLLTQREVWLNQGPLFDAIRASIAIPGIFTPYRVGGRDLVDGGLLAPLPIAATRLVRAGMVVAVDVNDRVPVALRHLRKARAEVEPAAAPTAETAVETEGLRAKVAAMLESIFDKSPVAPPQPGMLDLMSRSLDTMQAQLSRLQMALDPPDLLIRVPRDTCMFHEFWRAREVIEVGREAARRALAVLRGEAGDRAEIDPQGARPRI